MFKMYLKKNFKTLLTQMMTNRIFYYVPVGKTNYRKINNSGLLWGA